MVPAVDVPHAVSLDGDVLRFDIEFHDPTQQELPAEFYLRQARDVDLDDLEAVVELVQTHGYVVPNYPLDKDLPDRAPQTWDRELARFSARRGRRYERGPVRDEPGILSCHVDEVIYRLWILRALTEHALAYRRDDYEHRSWARFMDKPPPTDAAAWALFVEFVNAALREFHVRVSVDFGSPGPAQGDPRPTVYEAAVLQLVNDLADEADLMVRTCPHCGREFFRQVGRAKTRSRLEDVKFCSPQCGRAASVRTYRARKRAEREGK